MQSKPAITSVKIHDIIQNRWSPRAFAADKAVSHGDLLALLEAARWAASCFNEQPWRFMVFDKVYTRDLCMSILTDKNRMWATNAPVFILAVAMNNFSHNNQPNRWAMYDTGAACANLSLQATTLGLIVHQMGGFDVEKTRSLLQLPDDCTPMAMLAVGYQADVDVLHEDFKAIELDQRSRATLDERFYAEQWGKGIE